MPRHCLVYKIPYILFRYISGYNNIMRVTSLGSGSSGNALLVEAGPQARTKLLVDACLSPRLLIERLTQTATQPGHLQGEFITNHDSDHTTFVHGVTNRQA